MSTFKLAAIKVLKKHNKPLNYEKITDLAIEENLIDTTSKIPSNTMSAVITTSIKNDKKSPFRRINQGIYALNPNYVDTEQYEERKEIEEGESKKEGLEKLFVGSGGEHSVISELLFREYNANRMGVDVGMDVVAIKDKNVFDIQVKTANEYKGGKYYQNISTSSFKKFKSAKTFYIFVLRNKKQETNFLILPYTKMRENIEKKYIFPICKNKLYRVAISSYGEKLSLGKKSNDVTRYKNNWNQLK